MQSIPLKQGDVITLTVVGFTEIILRASRNGAVIYFAENSDKLIALKQKSPILNQNTIPLMNNLANLIAQMNQSEPLLNEEDLPNGIIRRYTLT